LTSRSLRWACCALVAAGATACLPNDTRKAPGSITTTVESDGAVESGIPASRTADGWNIAFDRLLVNLGDVSLDGDGCDEYSDAGYDRIFDMKTAGKQKVSVVYALGHCDYGFRVTSPDADTVLGQGATDDQKNLMRTPGSDLFNNQAGIGIYLRGHATLGGATKTFEWPFRLRARYSECSDVPGETAKRGIDLASGRAETVNLAVSPVVLFADRKDLRTARLRFQVFADADSTSGDNDGEVTLNELARVPLSAAGFVSSGADAGAGAGDLGGLDAGYAHDLELVSGFGPLTLEDYVYLVLFPAMVQYREGGACRIRLASRGLGG
jgi:hypothetical protein